MPPGAIVAAVSIVRWRPVARMPAASSAPSRAIIGSPPVSTTWRVAGGAADASRRGGVEGGAAWCLSNIDGAHLPRGLAVVVSLEGWACAICIGFMRRALASLAEAPESRLRLGGLIAAAGGIGLAWLLKLF